MIDELQAFIDLLVTDAAFAAVVTRPGRVWVVGPGGLTGITGAPPKAVVVETSAGSIYRTMPYIEPMYSLRCYGPTLGDAQDVARSLYAVFYYTTGNLAGMQKGSRMVNNRYLLQNASLTGFSAPTSEPQSNWPVAYRSARCRWDALTGN